MGGYHDVDNKRVIENELSYDNNTSSQSSALKSTCYNKTNNLVVNTYSAALQSEKINVCLL